MPTAPNERFDCLLAGVEILGFVLWWAAPWVPVSLATHGLIGFLWAVPGMAVTALTYARYLDRHVGGGDDATRYRHHMITSLVVVAIMLGAWAGSP